MKRILKLAGQILLGLVLASFVWVLLYRFVDPPITFLMLRDRVNGVDVQQQWVGLDEMSRYLPRAVIGGTHPALRSQLPQDRAQASAYDGFHTARGSCRTSGVEHTD